MVNNRLIARSLARIGPRLSAKRFFRANRSEIINLRRVTAIAPEGDGHIVTLLGGPSAAVSRGQAKAMREMLAL